MDQRQFALKIFLRKELYSFYRLTKYNYSMPFVGLTEVLIWTLKTISEDSLIWNTVIAHPKMCKIHS